MLKWTALYFTPEDGSDERVGSAQIESDTGNVELLIDCEPHGGWPEPPVKLTFRLPIPPDGAR